MIQKTTLTRIILTAACLLTLGCMTIEQIAPPVDQAIVAAAAENDIDQPSLERGRSLYLGKCARCHTAEPISGYTLDQWRKILPRMNQKTKLNDREATDVNGYVFTVRQIQP